MKQQTLTGALCAGLFALGTSTANAALIGVLPATPGGTDWQAYYDDQLNITWAANANINGAASWDDQMNWVAGLSINGVTGWRLPDVDVNDDGIVVNCYYAATQADCMDNEYSHLYNYGAGTVLGGGITPFNPGPFSNVQNDNYWSSTETANASLAYRYNFTTGGGGSQSFKYGAFYAWAVLSGNAGTGSVSAVPVPAAAWLFGSGLIGLVGVARRKH